MDERDVIKRESERFRETWGKAGSHEGRIFFIRKSEMIRKQCLEIQKKTTGDPERWRKITTRRGDKMAKVRQQR